MSLVVDIRKKLGGFSLNVAFETEQVVTGLLGASGAGKSMTLMCIAGIATPDKGRIALDGVELFNAEKNINLPPQKRKVGYLFQHYALFPHMSVRQNILCGVVRDRLDRGEQDRRLGEMLALMQLEELEALRPGQLSGGQRQRVALARILIGKPNMLMLDEPFAALDSYLRSRLRGEMKNRLYAFCKSGKTALVVTHDREDAHCLCDQFALIDGGRVLTHAQAQTMRSNPESAAAVLLDGCVAAGERWWKPYKQGVDKVERD